MKFLAVLICTINSWNVLLCCCATKVEVADKPGCHQVEMTCHESPATPMLLLYQPTGRNISHPWKTIAIVANIALWWATIFSTRK